VASFHQLIGSWCEVVHPLNSGEGDQNDSFAPLALELKSSFNDLGDQLAALAAGLIEMTMLGCRGLCCDHVDARSS
jgi:hypothetical protein